MLKKIHLLIWDSALYQKIRQWSIRFKMKIYLKRMPKIIAKLQQQKQINVCFFAVSISMWKYDRLFNLLLQDKRYNPYIVSFIYPHETPQERKNKQEQLKAYFRLFNFPFYESYDDKTETWITTKPLYSNPDIVIYSQPYNTGHKDFKIERYWRHCLFIYAPYCMMIEKSDSLYNTLLLNISYKVFCNSTYEKDLLSKIMYNKGRNLSCSGYLLFDEFNLAEETNQIWHDPSHIKKRIIWAPHHSIQPEDLLNYGTFLDVAEYMQHFAVQYQQTIEWIFKPHPMLRNKLYIHPHWGKEKTDNYFTWWASQPNTGLQEGEYIELFATSDAMIHDCSSFMGEYLYLDKPVLYIEKEHHTDLLNEFGKECLLCHYKASDDKGIDTFLRTTVLQNDDFLAQKRSDFRRKHYGVSKHESVAEYIKKEIDTIGTYDIHQQL